MFVKQHPISYKQYAISLDFAAFSKLACKKYVLQNITFFGIFFRENGVENGVWQIKMGYTKDDRRKAFGNIKG